MLDGHRNFQEIPFLPPEIPFEDVHTLLKLINVQVFNKRGQGREDFFMKLNKRTLHCTFIRDIRVLKEMKKH